MSRAIQAGPRDGWGMLAHAIELVHHPLHTTIVGPGVKVRLDPETGAHVAVAYGGIIGHVDEALVQRSAKANLAHWPVDIVRLEIEVSVREGKLPGGFSGHDRHALERARAKRDRKAARWKGAVH